MIKKFNNLADTLFQIYSVSKFVHWHRCTAYGQHLLFDRLAEDNLDTIDEMKEKFMLPEPYAPNAGILAPRTYAIGVQTVKTLFERGIEICQSINDDPAACAAKQSFVGNVAEMLSQKLGLLRFNGEVKV